MQSTIKANGICERFHQTIKNEFYASAFRRKLYHSIDELQAEVDIWIESYNAERAALGQVLLWEDTLADLH